MNGELLVVLLIMAIGSVILYFVWYRPKKKKKVVEAQKGCPGTHAGSTVEGVCLPRSWGPQEHHQIDRSDGGLVCVESPIIDEAIQAMIGARVINGLRGMIAAARHHNPSWTRYTDSALYKVFLIKKTATNMDGTPALLIGPNKIKSAGTVINIYADLVDRGETIIVLAEPDDWNNLPANYWDYLEAGAWNEGEHVIEYHNDKNVFRSKIGEGDIHPHWPAVTAGVPAWAPAGFVSQRSGRPQCVLVGGDPRIPAYVY